jgi:hypothetical protein
MIGREEQAAVQTDAYIDALLARHRGVPVAVPNSEAQPPAELRRLIHLLEAGLPRIHPSFSFEEGLAGRLRAAAATDGQPPAGQLIALPGILADVTAGAAIDRRLLIGGAALASGVSIAGAAVLAWRRLERSRRGWLD